MSFPNVFESTQPFSKQPPGIIGGHECWDSLPWPLVHSVQGGHRHRWEIRHGSKVRQWGKVGLTWSGILKLPQFFWGGICSETLKFSGSYKESSKPFAGFPSVVSRIWCSDTLEMTRGMFLMGILNPNKPCADATWRGAADRSWAFLVSQWISANGGSFPQWIPWNPNFFPRKLQINWG